MTDLIVGVGLVLVFEGLLYAALPDQLKAMMVELLQRPSTSLRLMGITLASIGLFIVWLVRG